MALAMLAAIGTGAGCPGAPLVRSTRVLAECWSSAAGQEDLNMAAQHPTCGRTFTIMAILFTLISQVGMIFFRASGRRCCSDTTAANLLAFTRPGPAPRAVLCRLNSVYIVGRWPLPWPLPIPGHPGQRRHQLREAGRRIVAAPHRSVVIHKVFAVTQRLQLPSSCLVGAARADGGSPAAVKRQQPSRGSEWARSSLSHSRPTCSQLRPGWL
jgi:hypothetical protein